jgi:hypothetical protein
MQGNKNEIAAAIARTNKTTQDEIFKIALLCGLGPEKVEIFYKGSPLGLWEIKEFVTWRKRLPDKAETQQVAQHGVATMRKLFK